MAKKITYSEIDLKREGLVSRKIALIQVKSPDFNIGWEKRRVSYYNRENDLLGFLNGNFQMRRNIVEEQVEKINRLINFAITGGAKILCFPNMVIPKEMDAIFKEKSIEEDVILISGFEYTRDHDGNLNNIIRLYLPEYFPDLSLEELESKKIFASKYDPEIKTGNRVNIYKNTGFGKFTILNCFDYSNLSILNEIAKRDVSIIFVTSYNPAFRLYHNYAMADSHRNYSYVVIVNSGDFGGSGIYAPRRYEGKLRVNNLLQGLKGKGEGIIIQDIDVQDLKASKKKTIHGWMNPPEIRPIKDEIDIVKINLKEDLKKDKIIIKLVELRAPKAKDYQENNWRFKNDYREEIIREIKNIMKELKDKEADFITFPEVSLPDGIEELLCGFSKEKNVYIMGGFEYNDNTQNICKIFTPHTPDENDFSNYQDILYKSEKTGVHYYYYTKLFRSKSRWR